jgi:hypothetical protein
MASVLSAPRITAAKLLGLLQQSDTSVADITFGFRRLHRLLESLPLTTDEFGFAHNWLTSAELLWQRGDRHAARYQINQVARKLML